jgi:hypothetical protein
MWSVFGLIAALALCIFVLVDDDWNHTKPPLNARASEATRRAFN